MAGGRWVVEVPPMVRTAFLLVLLLACPARATWSILIVDLSTGEVAMGIATCIPFFDIQPATMLVIPGVGAAAAQSFVGPLSLRQLIRAQLLMGTSPAQILNLLAAADPGHQSRQYGIIDTQGGVATFTGSGAGAFASGLTGMTGSLVYAIQGNVLTGMPVLTQAEQAILNTPGDLADKLMAAMDAARMMGGDGRCSCNPVAPTSCGSPPPSFTNSANAASMIVSRPGDLDAPCGGASGCVAGTYWMNLNVANQPPSALDPVIQLQGLLAAFRAAHVGRPDHFQSTATLSAGTLRANGQDTTTLHLVLRDGQGTPLAAGGAAVTVTAGTQGTTSDFQVGPVIDHGDGTYDVVLTAGLTPGTAELLVRIDDGLGGPPVQLGPPPLLVLDDPFGPCGASAVADGQGGFIDVLKVNGGAGSQRVVNVGVGQPLTLSMDPPPPGSFTPHFLLWVKMGVPAPGAEVNLGPSVGSLCFLPPPFAVDPSAFILVNTFGATPPGLLAATPAPWSATSPNGWPQAVDVTFQGLLVDGPGFDLAVTNAVLLRVELLAAPLIDAVSPESPMAGQTVTVTGSGFQPGVTVTLDGTAVSPAAVTADQIDFVMPAGVGCDASLTVTNVDQQSATAVLNPSPVITGTIFGTGAAAGGRLFLIQGMNLGAVTVTIGGQLATISSQNPGGVVVLTPPGSPGTVPVIVTSPAGCTATTTYTYL